MPDHEALLRVDLDRGTVSAETSDRGQSFFRCRRGFRLPSGATGIHAEETHVTRIGVKKSISDAVRSLPRRSVNEALRVRNQPPHTCKLLRDVFPRLSTRRAVELAQYQEDGPYDCFFHLLNLSSKCASTNTVSNLKGHELCAILWKRKWGRNEVQMGEKRLVIPREGAVTISLVRDADYPGK